MALDTQNLLLPGVVAVVVGLSVIYLIYRLFVSSSSSPKKGGNKKKDKAPSKKVNRAAKRKAPQQTVDSPQQSTKAAATTTTTATTASSVSKNKKKKGDKVTVPAVTEQPKDVAASKKPAQKKRKVKEDLAEFENIGDFLPIILSKEAKSNETKETSQTKQQPTGKSKIAAAKGEGLSEGWEIVGLRKQERKEEKKKEKDQEIEKLKKEKEEQEKKQEGEGAKKELKGKEGGKKGEKRERREGRDGARGERGLKGNRPGGDRKRKGKDDDKKDQVPAIPQVSEKTKRREEIKINGILFSKFKDDEEDDEDWELLSYLIENGSSNSDDISPLRTAHLELRYYSPAKETASPALKKRTAASPAVEKKSPSEAWTAPDSGELAKYNYTQGVKSDDADKEKEEGSSEVQTRAWDVREEQPTGLPDEKTSELIEAYIKALGHPFTSNLAPARLSVKGKPQRFLIQTDVDTLRARLLKLLSSGVSLEPPVCRSQSEAAEFVEKLLGYLDAPFVCYTNESQSADGTYSRGAKFWRKGFGDAGFFIISATKIVMIWFIGYD